MSVLPMELQSSQPAPEVLVGYVSVRSQGGRSPVDVDEVSDSEPFRATSEDRSEAARTIESVGLHVLSESRLGLSVAGPAAAYEELTGGTVVVRERLLQTEMGRRRYVTHVDIVGSDQPAA